MMLAIHMTSLAFLATQGNPSLGLSLSSFVQPDPEERSDQRERVEHCE
jgi:hypothetical protein